MFMSDRLARLEKEQADLLVMLVEAYRTKREPFFVLSVANSLGEIYLRHSGLVDGTASAPQPDLQMLERERLLMTTERGRGTSFFVPTPEGMQLYREIKANAGTPVTRVETEVRQLLSTGAITPYPRAFEAWRAAESLYWQLDAADHRLSQIGHLCRDSIQAFAEELAKRHGITDIDPDPTKTINRVTAVLRAKAGDTGVEFLDALVDYWRKVNGLIQRQVHRGQKEGRPIDLEDARVVVFQTLLVMYEVHRAASRP
jgi:hypothetical protein